jgi:TusA-related sulfurtransferase
MIVDNLKFADRELDVTADVCPMTFVRTRLALDAMASGALLRVWLRGEEPARSVPETAAALGHAVVSIETAPDGRIAVLIRRA